MTWIGIDDDPDRRRIGPRLQHALVADLVVDDLADPEADEILRRRQDDEHDWTENLARQLHVRWNDDVHETLLVIVLELDRAMQRWPDLGENFAPQIVHEATKNMTAPEALSMLLAGPPSWQSKQINCRLDKLADRLRPTLEKSVTTALSAVLEKWAGWDIRTLRDRARKAAETAARARASGVEPGPRMRSPRDPKRVEGYYTPPPRT